MSAKVNRTIWGQVRTAKVTMFDKRRECGVAVDVDNNAEIFFTMRQCRKVRALNNGRPSIGREVFRQWPRVGNRILFIQDHRSPAFESEKHRAYVWGYEYFYLLQSSEDQGDARELEAALDGKIIPMTSAEPRNGKHQPMAQVSITSISAAPPVTTEPEIHEWSPGTSGSVAETNNPETVGDELDPVQLALTTGGHNGGKKPKPGQMGWVDGRGRKGRGLYQGWRRRH